MPGVGWVPMDPTGATTPVLDPHGEGPQILLAQLARWVVEWLPRDPVVWLLAAVAATVVTGAGIAGTRWRRQVALRRASPWAQLLDRLRRRGVDPQPAETPVEVVARARRLLPDIDAEALRVLQAYEESRRYAGTDPDRTTAEEALTRL